MERYLLFRGRNYYPSGGIDDLIGDYKTLALAIEAAKEDIVKDYGYTIFDTEQEYIDYEKENSWGYIYDTQTKTKVWEQKELN